MTRTSTWPAPGIGVSTWRSSKTSGPPNRGMVIARIIVCPLHGQRQQRLPWSESRALCDVSRRTRGRTQALVARVRPRVACAMPFSPFGLHRDLLRGIKELGFARPTPIQSEAMPPALAGHDVLACAMTGSGKTAAFLLPILQRLIDRPRGTTRALILAPTRELAAQIEQHCTELGQHTPVTAAAIFGGVGMGPQEHAFRSGVDILIATPGRLLDHLRQPYADLRHLEVLVLDEADRMLDMGFLPDIRRVLKHVPAKRQTLFYSATLPAPIQALAQEMLKSPATINIERK